MARCPHRSARPASVLFAGRRHGAGLRRCTSVANLQRRQRVCARGQQEPERSAADDAQTPQVLPATEQWHSPSGSPHVLLTTVLAAGGGGLLGLFPSVGNAAGAIEAVLILAGIVAFHELGHFVAARAQGIHVSKFSVGFGPKLLSFKPNEVEYSLRALPLGGFVAFPDNDEDCPYPKDDPDLLKNRPIIQRALVISAGVVFNIILAFTVLVAQVNSTGYFDYTYGPGVQTGGVLPGGAGARYGLQRGDVILEIDGKPIKGGSRAVSEVIREVKSHTMLSLELKVARPVEGSKDRSIETLQVLPDVESGKGKIGVQLAPNAKGQRKQADNAVDLLVQSGNELRKMLTGTVDGVVSMAGSFDQAKDSLSGPVAVVSVGAEVANKSPSGLYTFAAIVNVNLAVINMLPLPALDGGYMLLLGIEAARGKKLPEAAEAIFQAAGLLLLLGLGGVLLVKDTLNILPK